MEVTERMKKPKVAVKKPALMARLNRKLAHEEKHLYESRSAGAKSNMGDFFVVNSRTNTVVDWHVNPVQWARELGVLAAWEEAEGFE